MAADAFSRPASSEQPAAISPGYVVLIVGPSGAGKDTVLREAREILAGDDRFFFPRRVVTRPENASEEHTSLSCQAFEDQLKRGAFTLHWRAHGLHYGIPAEADDATRRGETVVFNTSRHAVPAARTRYAATAVVVIDAPIEVRVARLAARNRERPEEIQARLERVVSEFTLADADLTIDNGGTPQEAAHLLIDWLRALPTRRV